MDKQSIRIKLRAYDNKVLDRSTEEILNTVKRTGANIKGPIPLATKIERYTVLSISSVDKSKTLLSYARKCILIFWFSIVMLVFLLLHLEHFEELYRND